MVDDELWSDGHAAGVTGDRHVPATWISLDAPGARVVDAAPDRPRGVVVHGGAVSRWRRTAGLIQRVNGVELPAAGTWSITARQRLAVFRPWAFRVSTIETIAGTLDVDAGRLSATMWFVARAPDRPSPHIGYTGRLASADRCGRWSFDGFGFVDGRRIPRLRIAVTYLGVFDRGAAPVALLQLDVHCRYPRRVRRLDGRLSAVKTVNVADPERYRLDDCAVDRWLPWPA